MKGEMVKVPPPIFVTIKERVSGLPPKAIVPNCNDFVESWACGGRAMPVPDRLMVWVTGGMAFSVLSERAMVALNGTADCGVKSRLRLHSAPGARETVLMVQSGTMPGPGTTVKSVVSLRLPLLVSGALPMFWNWMDCGLSLLVEPTLVEAKLSEGGWER